MAKRTKDPIEELKSSAERVWLAGLGALAEAEKRGDKLFKELVRKGKNYEDLLPDAGESLKDSVDSARKQANLAWKDFESVFDEKVQGAMSRMGVARQSEVDALKQEVERLRKARRASAKKAPKKKAKKRSAANKSTTRTSKSAKAKKKPAKKKSTRKKTTAAKKSRRRS